MTESLNILEVDPFALDRLHDICMEIGRPHDDTDFTHRELIDIWNSLPFFLKLEALQWGLDTSVSDEIYLHIKTKGAPHVSTP